MGSGIRNAGWTAAFLLFLAGLRVEAGVRMPDLFTRHMVLQRDRAVPVWGWAEPDEEVTVSIANQSKVTRAGADRKWLVILDPLQAGGPHCLSIKGRNTVAVEDVLVGEVWLVSGQSNMVSFLSTSLEYEKER